MVWAELGLYLRPLIESIKLPEFYSEEESRTSLRAVWAVAVNERERRLHKRPTNRSNGCPLLKLRLRCDVAVRGSNAR